MPLPLFLTPLKTCICRRAIIKTQRSMENFTGVLTKNNNQKEITVMMKMMKRAMALVLACMTVVGMMIGGCLTVKADAATYPLYQKYQAPERTWKSLTDCEKHSASNEEGHFADVKIGNWDTRSGKLKDSIRFCVANKKSYRNTHYINYKLDGKYTEMTGLVSFCDKSEDFAEAEVKIYLDNELAYESIQLSDLSDDDDFTLDVEDVKMVRIVCSTTKKVSAFCAVAVSVR